MRKTGSCPTPEQQRCIVLKRSRLQERVDAFQKQAAKLLNAVPGDEDQDDSWDEESARETYEGKEFDGVGEGEDDDEHALGSKSSEAAGERDQLSGNCSSEGRIDAEYIALHLPSHLGHKWCSDNSAEDLAAAELRLREGQLNDSLHHIRIALGHKSYLFRNDVRPARTQKPKTRAWTEVHNVESEVQNHARVYMRARKAMENLGADDILLDRYKVLTRQDLSIKTSAIAPHVRGQRNQSLPWFWTIDVRRDNNAGEWMKDCTCSSIYKVLICVISIQSIAYIG